MSSAELTILISLVLTIHSKSATSVSRGLCLEISEDLVSKEAK